MTMKRLTTTLFTMCLFFACTIQAQTIKMGDKFFDGATLFKVQEIRMGKYVSLEGSNGLQITLEKVDGKQGEYTLQPSSQADEPPFRGAQFGWRVQYVRKDGMNFLAVRKPNKDAMWLLVLTPDNLENCLAQEKDIERELPSEITSNTLLNRHYLSKIPDKTELRLMRNEILARHGYRFKSKDLQEWFGNQFWYKPGNNNDAIKLNVIEQVNIELIKSEEADR